MATNKRKRIPFAQATELAYVLREHLVVNHRQEQQLSIGRAKTALLPAKSAWLMHR